MTDWSPELLERARAPLSSVMEGQGVSVPAPPGNGSDETRHELDRLLWLQDAARDPRRVLAIVEEHAVPDIGPLLKARGLVPAASLAPTAWTLLEHGLKDVEVLVLREKIAHNRARPTQLEQRLEALLPIPPHAAYPSGHASQAHFVAEVLERLVPDCASSYRAFATSVALNREVAGVHYASDSRAGAQLAGQYGEILAASTLWQDLFAKAASEMEAHVAKAGCPDPNAGGGS